MAKQTSKYFGSVITKLIAARRKENIVVDSNLKQQLREGLIARAELMGGAEKAGWQDYITKWRYPLALVPSALLLMLVAAHVMKMPVEIDSDVVVPVTSTSEKTQEVEVSGGREGIEDAQVAKLAPIENGT